MQISAIKHCSMLKHRIIPVLLIKDGQLVKGEKFDSWRIVGHPLQTARIHNMRDVDELILLDISATPNNTLIDTQLVEDITKDCFMPLTVGGGIRTLEDIRCLLRAGADKVSINTAACDDPFFIREAAQKYGKQCITVSIDLRGFWAYSECGTHDANLHHKCWARLAEYFGAGEILLNNIDLDGTMDGYDLDLIHRISSAVNIPVIACGGAASEEDCARAIEAGASAVAVGALFQFTPTTPAMVAQHFLEHNIPVRI